MVSKAGADYLNMPEAPRTDRGNDLRHQHTVQFYGDDAFLVDGLSRYFESALAAGQAGLVIATEAHRDALTRRLMERGVDLGLATRQGRYVALDAAETLARVARDGRPDAARFAEVVGRVVARAAANATGGGPRVAAFGEIVALLCAAGQHEVAIQVEEFWNDLSRTHRFRLRCAYPMDVFRRADDGALLGRICATHSAVEPSESFAALVEDDERQRAIALLQQKARALETEVAERRRVERELRERNEELTAAIAARDAFLSVAAHELKTPVTSLRAYAQLLLRDTRRQRTIATDRLESALTTIERQTGKLNHLVERLLDTAQIQAGKLLLQPARTDLVALVRSALAEQDEGADHRFVVDGSERLEATVDPVRFEQVVTNLLTNAVKFSPEGGVITVRLGREADGGVQLCVSDEGVGVPLDQREAVFDRFHQAHGGRHLSGMGLGLFIAREIVELHGGTVRVEEPEGGGARFVVLLPPA
jgi:signal transduction histidine kinase